MMTARIDPLAQAEVQAAPVQQGVRKLNIGGIKKAEAAKPQAKYPTFPDPTGEGAPLADYVLKHEDVPDQLKQAKTTLAELVSPYWFEFCSGKQDTPSSVLVKAPAGLARVTFPNRYIAAGVTEEAVEAVLNGRVGLFFRQKLLFKIDADKVPAAAAPSIIEKLQELFASAGCSDALSVNETLVPVETFHKQRHLDLTIEQNMALQKACRITTTVTGKNVRA